MSLQDQLQIVSQQFLLSLSEIQLAALHQLQTQAVREGLHRFECERIALNLQMSVVHFADLTAPEGRA